MASDEAFSRSRKRQALCSLALGRLAVFIDHATMLSCGHDASSEVNSHCCLTHRASQPCLPTRRSAAKNTLYLHQDRFYIPLGPEIYTTSSAAATSVVWSPKSGKYQSRARYVSPDLDYAYLSTRSKSLPYLAYIKSLSVSWRTLLHLVDWMEVGTTPLRWNEIKNRPQDREQRVNKTNLTFVEYQLGTAPTTIRINTPTELKYVLYTRELDHSKRSPLKLFIVEDLSQQVIELLGSRFTIDPRFFRDQIDDYIWYSTRDPWAMPPSRIVDTKHRQWFRLRNFRLRYHDSQQDFDASRLDTNSWNVLRRLDDDANNWHYADKDGAVVSMLRTRTTIWIGKDSRHGNGTVGIVLLDPTVGHGDPLWYDRTNWLPVPEMDAKIQEIKFSVSWYDDIVQMTRLFPWFDSGATQGHEMNAQVVTKPTLYTICAEWLVVCDYVRARLSQIERELELPRVFRSKDDAIDASLTRLHTWRGALPVFREMVTETLSISLPVTARLTASLTTGNSGTNTDTSDGFLDIEPDFRRVLALLTDLQERVDRLSGIVTSEISIEDSRRGLEESRNMARLTWLATIFIPMTFVSGLYSMNDSVSATRETQWIYFATAIPFTLFVMAIGWFVGGGSLMLWKTK